MKTSTLQLTSFDLRYICLFASFCLKFKKILLNERDLNTDLNAKNDGFGSILDVFLSAAQPTDQGEESVVLLVVVIVVVGGGGTIF